MIAQATRRAGWLGDRTLLGVAIFVGSESIFFLSIVVAYVANRDAGLGDARATLDLPRTTVFSLALFASSATMARATTTLNARWLLATIALGGIFIVGQGTDKNLTLASRNISHVALATSDSLSTYDVLRPNKLVFTRSAFEQVEARLTKD